MTELKTPPGGGAGSGLASGRSSTENTKPSNCSQCGSVTVSRVGKGQTGDYIGRPFRWLKGSPLANPYRLPPNETEAERAECIARYEAWLRERLQEDGAERAALDDLIQRYRNGEDISLLCWCKPKACHGDVIARLIAEEVSE